MDMFYAKLQAKSVSCEGTFFAWHKTSSNSCNEKKNYSL